MTEQSVTVEDADAAAYLDDGPVQVEKRVGKGRWKHVATLTTEAHQ